MTVLLPGPPLFSERVLPWAATVARDSSGQTFSNSGVFRLQFWQQAVEITGDHLWTGVGFGRFGLSAASELDLADGTAGSAFAHSGPLQALADGGLLLGVPVLLALGLVVWAACRRLALRRPASTDRLIGAAGAVAVLTLLAHSSLDFDWTYPALAAIFAAVVALAAATPRGRELPSPEGAAQTGLAPATAPRAVPAAYTVTASVVLVVATVGMAAAAWGQDWVINLPFI